MTRAQEEDHYFGINPDPRISSIKSNGAPKQGWMRNLAEYHYHFAKINRLRYFADIEENCCEISY
jgi:hypothetical protein